MKPRHPADPRDVPGFRWRLHALERKHAMALDRASLALAAAQRESLQLQRQARECRLRQVEHERWARAGAGRDPRLQGEVLRWLLSCGAELAAATTACDAQGERVQALRAQCVERQRQLDAVQSLHDQARRAHAQARFRSDSREADAAWLARRTDRLEGRA